MRRLVNRCSPASSYLRWSTKPNRQVIQNELKRNVLLVHRNILFVFLYVGFFPLISPSFVVFFLFFFSGDFGFFDFIFLKFSFYSCVYYPYWFRLLWGYWKTSVWKTKAPASLRRWGGNGPLGWRATLPPWFPTPLSCSSLSIDDDNFVGIVQNHKAKTKTIKNYAYHCRLTDIGLIL